MELVSSCAGYGGEGDSIERARSRVDDRSAENALFGRKLIQRDNGCAETGLPQGSCRIRIIRVEREDGIMHRGDIHDIMRACGWDSHAGHIKRLGVNNAIYAARIHFSELTDVHVARVQCGLSEICSSTAIVVLRRTDRNLCVNDAASY